MLAVSRFGYFFDLAVVTETVTKQFPEPPNATSLPLETLQTSLDILEILMVTFAPRGTFIPETLATCELAICWPLANFVGVTKVEVGGFGAINSTVRGAGVGVGEGDGAPSTLGVGVGVTSALGVGVGVTSTVGDGDGSGVLETDGAG